MTSSSDVAARGEVTAAKNAAEVEAPQRARRPRGSSTSSGSAWSSSSSSPATSRCPFQGKTFSERRRSRCPAPGSARPPSGACVGRDADDPRVDYFAARPGRSTRGCTWCTCDAAEHDLPLWNPYQGIGAPLAGNMQSSVFDPFPARPARPRPRSSQDLTLLVGLLLIGAAAYFAARMLRLGVLAAVLTGSVYGLSGWFFVYSNDEWFRTYMYLPFLLGSPSGSSGRHGGFRSRLLGSPSPGCSWSACPSPPSWRWSRSARSALVRIFVGDRSGDWWQAALASPAASAHRPRARGARC